MEHRLCYQHGAPEVHNAPRAASSPESAHETIEQKVQKDLNRLSTEKQDQIFENAFKAAPNDPAKQAEWMTMHLTNLKQRSVALSQTFATELEDVKKDINASLIGKERIDVLTIISALQRPLPNKSGVTHRYGNSDTGIDFIRIETDQRYLRSLRNAFPQVEGQLQRIDTALTQLTKQDIRYEVRQFELSNQHHKVDHVIGGMAKLSGVLIMVAGVLLTGVPAIMHSWKNKKLELQHFTPALFYAAVATIIASPSLRRQIFSSKEQNVLADIDTTLNNPQFKKHVEDYHLQGPAAANIVQKMMDQPSETKKITAKLRAAGQSTKGLEKDIEAYIKGITTDNAMRAELQRMFTDGRFSDLPHMLSFTTTTEAKGVVLDYIRIGARPYNQQMQQTANQLKAPTK